MYVFAMLKLAVGHFISISDNLSTFSQTVSETAVLYLDKFHDNAIAYENAMPQRTRVVDCGYFC